MFNRRAAGLPIAVVIGAGCVLVVCVVAAILAWRLGLFDEHQSEPRVGMATSTGKEGAVRDLAEYADSLLDSGDPYFGTRQLDYLLEQAENPTFDTDTWRVNILTQLAFHRLRLGEVDESIRLLTEALELSDPDGFDHIRIMEDLAVAYMKQGELRNCVSPEGRLVCALPLDPAHSHEDISSATKATDILESLLAHDPESVRYRWLLNVAHMALGTYPDGMPREYVISPDVFAPEYELGRFEEIASDIGIYGVDLAGGAIIEDFDNDGLLDIMTSTWDPAGSLKYYRNEGDGRFSERTESAGLSRQYGGLNITQADYDNDGWVDVLVMRGGWLLSRGQMRMSLLHNNGDGTFSDVTREAGLAIPAYPSQSAAWGDYDNDGDLDLFSCSESMPETPEVGAAIIFPSRLFRNDGDGTFTDVADAAGVTNLRYCKGSAWGDYDNDGDPDLYVSNYAGENRLYRNDGDGTFSDIAHELGLTGPLESFPTWFWDYDNDGWLDLFVAGYASDIELVAKDYLGIPNDGARPRLYRNDGAGGFEDATERVGLDRVSQTMGANFGDMDNDGFPDIYLGTGFPAFDALAPNVAYRNDDGESFSDVTFSAGLGHIQKGHGIAFGDIDRDGDQDIFMQVGGFYPSDGFLNALYVNTGNGNGWLSVRLVGVESNRSAIGARIRVTILEDGARRDIHAVVGSGGSFGASSLEQEIGLGAADAIESLEVYWPTSGIRQIFEEAPLNSAIEIREDADGYVVRDMPRIELGGVGK